MSPGEAIEALEDAIDVLSYGGVLKYIAEECERESESASVLCAGPSEQEWAQAEMECAKLAWVLERLDVRKKSSRPAPSPGIAKASDRTPPVVRVPHIVVRVNPGRGRS